MNYSRKWDGLINYVKEKLKTATYVAVVASGLSIVAVRDAIAAKRQSLDSVWQSPITHHTANRNVVLKWMENNKMERILDMWGMSSDVWARMREGLGIQVDPEDVEEAKLKREAEMKVEEAGEGECVYCHQEIVKNDLLGIWESEFLIGYCTDSRDHKHKPKIVWKTTDE